MIADIKPRAKEIMKADGLNLTIGAGIFVLIEFLASQIGGGIISDALSGLISSVSAACSACFFFRAYNRGKADIKDVYSLLTDSVHLSKVISIMLAMWLVNTLLYIVAGFMVIIPLIEIIILLVATLLIGFLLMIVWYLFVANPEYPTEYYLKGSSRYMGPEIVAYIGFIISVAIGPVLIEALISIFLGSTIASIICIPFDAYINLASAGFVANIIPDKWYSGTAQF